MFFLCFWFFILSAFLDVDATIIRKVSIVSMNTENPANVDDDLDENTVVNSTSVEEKIDKIAHGGSVDVTGSEPAEIDRKTDIGKLRVSDAPTLKGPDNQTLLRLLEEGEELQSMFR